MGYFSKREKMKKLLYLRHPFQKVKMGEDKRLKINGKLLVRRKNKVVGELDQALEILTATSGIELKTVLGSGMGFVLVLMAVTMQARRCRIDKTAAQMVVFGAIVELHVPTH